MFIHYLPQNPAPAAYAWNQYDDVAKREVEDVKVGANQVC